ncbi:MAG: HD domain-containing phosphohydrolase [Sulfuricurvum sp.]|jgi:PAS domain S-box-containing protein
MGHEYSNVTHKKIEHAHQEWIAALDVVKEAIFMHDKEFRIIRCNRAYQRYATLPFDQIIGQPYYEVFPKTHTPLPHCQQNMENNTAEGEEDDIQVGDSIFSSHAYTIKDKDGNYLYSIHILENTTKRMQAKLNLRESEERYRTLFETMLNGFAYCQMVYEEGVPVDFIYLDVNKAFEQQTGLKDVVGKLVSEVIPGIRQSDPELLKRYGRVASGSKPEQFEFYVQSLEMWFSTSVYSPKPEHFVAIFDVITERKKAEEMLKNEVLRRRLLMESSRDGIAIINQHHQIVEANARFAEMLGYRPEEMLGLHTWDYEAIMSEAEIRGNFPDLSNVNMTIESRHRRKDGTMYDVEVSISGTMVGNEAMVFTVSRDITERKQAEESLRRANRALTTLSAGNLALVRATNEDMLLQSVTNVIVEKGNYSLAIVCYAENDPEKSITPMVWSGTEDSDFVEGCRMSDTEQEQLPIARAIHNKTTQILRDIASEAESKPWRDAALARGYVSNITLPLYEGSIVFGALSIYASEANAFDKEEIRLLEELSSDLAYGIITLRTRVEHEQHAILLRRSMEQSIQTIAATLEARDPYTAGHQERVGELATAIAQEMGLSEEQIQGIHFAAIIHDLGKIHIPAEILSKPGKLSDIEFMLIKTHPQEGYDILKEVQFPWPIADIILQHHEKLDGSGYPNGLKGEQILLEARIICVADVVEAMSSHRPYRPGLGIESAMDEIKKGRDRVYDSDVVDACLKLFMEKGFAFGVQSL